MTDRKFSSAVASDRQLARLVIEQPGKRKVTLQELDVAEVDALIVSLMDARAMMAPPVAEKPDTKTEFLTTYRWSGIGVRANGCRPLAIRHPGFGWFGLLMPDDDAAKLAAWATRPMADDTPMGHA